MPAEHKSVESDQQLKQSTENKMDRVTIILVGVITMALYGKVQCCNSTYDFNNTIGIQQQYNSNINCSNACMNAVHRSRSLTNELSKMRNNTVFIFKHTVSFNDRSVAI